MCRGLCVWLDVGKKPKEVQNRLASKSAATRARIVRTFAVPGAAAIAQRRSVAFIRLRASGRTASWWIRATSCRTPNMQKPSSSVSCISVIKRPRSSAARYAWAGRKLICQRTFFARASTCGSSERICQGL